MKRMILAFLCCIFGAVATAQAGTTGNVSGYVRDEGGQPIANATVKIVSASEARQTHTDENGFYTMMSVSPDTYTVAVEKDGYRSSSNAGFLVASDASSRTFTKLMRACLCMGRASGNPRGSLVSADRTWDSYIVPRFLIESQIP
jgi:hypothetical protein